MLFAVLEFGDFAIITILILVFASVRAATPASLRPTDRDRLQRVERKLDLILTQLGIDPGPSPKTAWQELADDPAQKIAAIKAYREHHSVGLFEAKKGVEDYIQGKSA